MQHHPRKRFGQNFLKDQTIINRIIQSINPKPNNCMIEIGPGQGALTKHLIQTVQPVIAIELDRDLVDYLQQTFSEDQLIVHQADILQFDFNQLTRYQKQIRVVGNLPYNISTPLLFHLVKFVEIIHDMYFMLQQEVAERLVAQPSDKAYGRMSVMLQYYFQIETLFGVPPQAFFPAPKVNSTVIRMQSRQDIIPEADDLELFANVVRMAFSQRRKTVKNNLQEALTKYDWSQLNLDCQMRPQQLSLQDYVKISNHLVNKSEKNEQ